MDGNRPLARLLIDGGWASAEAVEEALARVAAGQESDILEALRRAGSVDPAALERLRRTLSEVTALEARRDTALDAAATVIDSAARPGGEGGWVGRRLGKYQVSGVLGRGGMGVVLLAEHPELGDELVLKVLSGAAVNLEQVVRMQREAQVQMRLRHPNIAIVRDFDIDAGSPYIVMDRIQGTDLKAVLDQARSEGEAPDFTALRRIFARVAEALQVCHAAGVIHRDIKPANILIRDEDGEPVLIDFGLVKQAPSREAQAGEELIATVAPESLRGSARFGDGELTEPGALAGTPAFMSPEQYELPAGAELGPETDVWSLGATLYYALIGEAPFAGRSPIEIQASMQRSEEALSRLDACGAPALLVELCRACLQGDPARRPSMEAITRKLRPGLRVPRAWRFAAAAVLIMALGLGFVLGRRPPITIRFELAEGGVPVVDKDGKLRGTVEHLRRGRLEIAGQSVRVDAAGAFEVELGEGCEHAPLKEVWRCLGAGLMPKPVLFKVVEGPRDQVMYERPFRMAKPGFKRALARRLLSDLRAWNAATIEEQDIAAEQAQLMLGPDFDPKSLRAQLTDDKGVRRRVFSLEHKPSGLVFQIIPGTPFDLQGLNPSLLLERVRAYALLDQLRAEENLRGAFQSDLVGHKVRLEPFIISRGLIPGSVFAAGGDLAGVEETEALGALGSGLRLPYEEEWSWALKAPRRPGAEWGRGAAFEGGHRDNGRRGARFGLVDGLGRAAEICLRSPGDLEGSRLKTVADFFEGAPPPPRFGRRLLRPAQASLTENLFRSNPIQANAEALMLGRALLLTKGLWREQDRSLYLRRLKASGKLELELGVVRVPPAKIGAAKVVRGYAPGEDSDFEKRATRRRDLEEVKGLALGFRLARSIVLPENS